MKTRSLTLHRFARQMATVGCLWALLSLTACRREAADKPTAQSNDDAATGTTDGRVNEPAQTATPDASAAQPAADPAAGATVDAPAESAEATAADATKSRPEDFLPLVGRWVRTDSPYVIEIRGVGRDGSLEAAYYNPRPIRVSRAMAQKESGELQVFVELRDVNYPGSTYTLVYNRTQNVLQGIYYQATMGQRFDVVFARLRPEDVEQ